MNYESNCIKENEIWPTTVFEKKICYVRLTSLQYSNIFLFVQSTNKLDL